MAKTAQVIGLTGHSPTDNSTPEAQGAGVGTGSPIWWSGNDLAINTTGTISPGTTWATMAPSPPPVPHTYVPPEEFQQQVVELIQLLRAYGPKLRVLADVLGAMKIEEEDNAK